MRADGRRLGRIIGQLDDLQALVSYYHTEEKKTVKEFYTTKRIEGLALLLMDLEQAEYRAQGILDEINKETKG